MPPDSARGRGEERPWHRGAPQGLLCEGWGHCVHTEQVLLLLKVGLSDKGLFIVTCPQEAPEVVFFSTPI